MPTINVVNFDGQVVGELTLSERVFGAAVNEGLLHQAVVAYEANQRSGRASTKTRSQVRGGGRKPWRQKGTGRARAGTTRAPHWRHGGVVFGPHPRDFSIKFPRKMRQAALRQALSARLGQQELVVVDSMAVGEGKTKDFLAALDRLNLGRNVLLVTATPDNVVKQSSRNVKEVKATTTDSLNVYNLLRYHRLVLDRQAVAAIEEVFGE